MWIKTQGGNLIHLTDTNRVKFRTNISRKMLEDLTELAEEHDTHVNYLLETGLQRVLADGVILYNKQTRPKDRVQYKTTYEQALLAEVKQFARDHGFFINDVIEYSMQFVDPEKSKKKGHRYRIEKM